MNEKKKYIDLISTYTDLPDIFYSKEIPDKVPNPELIVLNEKLVKELGLDLDFFKSSDGLSVLSGNEVIEGSIPIAQAYGGHQFGYFNMLGDGRAVLLGEYITPEDKLLDIGLKGSGKTLYSRGGDGKAAVGPMLREYIISEAMEGLRIPTTRSLAVVKTGEKIIRDKILDGAIVTRVASSHIRVGTFQFASTWGSIKDLKALADYTINRHYKNIANRDNKYLLLLEEVIKKQAKLICKWQLVGFIHGVMNTDNMTISGETIDYGPCAFMDKYDPNTVFSSIDTEGRYAYGNQPDIGGWNLARFAEAIIPLIDEDRDKAIELAQRTISNYPNLYEKNCIDGMRRKLGLFNEEDGDEALIEALLSIMNKYDADYTNTFLKLTLGNSEIIEDTTMDYSEEYKSWFKLWKERLSRQNQSEEEIKNLMEENNPWIIPRNFRVEEALESAVNGDYTVMEQLLELLREPYNYSNIKKEYTNLPKACKSPYRTFCGT